MRADGGRFRLTGVANRHIENLSGVVGNQGAALASLAQRYPAVLLEQNQPAPVVAQQLNGLVQEIRSHGKASQVLGYVANAVSIGASFGRFSFNVVGLLAMLAGLLGA